MLIVLEHCLDRLLLCRDYMSTTNEDDTKLPTAPVATVFNLLNGTTTTSLPSHDAWKKSYQKDKECSKSIDILANPGTVTNKTLQTVHFK